MKSNENRSDDAPTKGTLTVEEAARMLGVSRTLAYESVRQHDELAGVRVVRIGQRILIPRAALERVLNGT